jgi:hypothetical protein
MIEKHSATWRTIEEELTNKVSSLRDNLEAKNMSDIETAFLRGRIAALREVLAMKHTELGDKLSTDSVPIY